MKIVYTPIHGTGVELIPASLRNFGFTNIVNVPEQDIPSGDFPTVESPNPEVTSAMALAIAKAKEVGEVGRCNVLCSATNVNGRFTAS